MKKDTQEKKITSKEEKKPSKTVKKTTTKTTDKAAKSNAKSKETSKSASKSLAVSKVTNEKKEVKNNKNTSGKKEKFLAFFEKVDEKKNIIIAFVLGLVLGLIILVIVYPERIAKLKDGTEPIVTFDDETITADDLYATMKDSYSISLLIDKIDRTILEKMYEDTDEMKTEVEETAEYWINLYEQNGYDEESFLSNNGFKDKDAFLDYLSLDNRRQKYFSEYLESLISDDDINKYYESNVYGDTDTKHILVEVDEDSDDGMSDDDAKALANEIIEKLNNGTSWDDVISEYEDKITSEELGYQAYNASLDEAYLKEMLALENGSYSKEPIKSSYGYHIVYRIDQKEKPELDDVRDSIIEDLSDEMKEKDENLYYKALIKLREDKNISFVDSSMKSKYDEYCSEYK